MNHGSVSVKCEPWTVTCFVAWGLYALRRLFFNPLEVWCSLHVRRVRASQSSRHSIGACCGWASALALRALNNTFITFKWKKIRNFYLIVIYSARRYAGVYCWWTRSAVTVISESSGDPHPACKPAERLRRKFNRICSWSGVRRQERFVAGDCAGEREWCVRETRLLCRSGIQPSAILVRLLYLLWERTCRTNRSPPSRHEERLFCLTLFWLQVGVVWGQGQI